MKDKIIDQIIKNLIPLRTLYKEIDTITNDLLIDNLESLEIFLENEFKDVNYSTELKDLITYLTENNILPIPFLNNNETDFPNTKLSEIDQLNYNKSILIGFKPLNVKATHLENIKNNVRNDINKPGVIFFNSNEISPKSTYTPSLDTFKTTSLNEDDKLVENNSEEKKLIPINEYTFEEDTSTIANDEEFLSLEDTQIEKLRKIILNAQLNYLNNANSFIEELERKEDVELYQTLLSLNDIRYIHHSISKLSTNTLNRLLIYVEELLKENNHNSINIFIEEAIKKILHDKQKKM